MENEILKKLGKIEEVLGGITGKLDKMPTKSDMYMESQRTITAVTDHITAENFAKRQDLEDLETRVEELEQKIKVLQGQKSLL